MSTIEHDYAPICDLYERHLGSALFEPYAIDLARRVADTVQKAPFLKWPAGPALLLDSCALI